MWVAKAKPKMSLQDLQDDGRNREAASTDAK